LVEEKTVERRKKEPGGHDRKKSKKNKGERERERDIY